MDLALFDLDNTLIAGDSDFEWAQFLIGKGILDRALYEARNIEFYEQYKAGTLDIDVFLDFQLQPLSRFPRAELDTWQREFLSRHIVPLIGAKARALVREHLDDGALCAIVTATNSFVTGPIVREFGIAHLIATIPAQDNGQFTGQPRGHTVPSAKARSSASRPGSKPWGCGGAASSVVGSTATLKTTCPCCPGSVTRWSWTPTLPCAPHATAAGWPILSLLG
jgi:HAD superfamily phosphoserine phosphatase-like hydrolase